MELTRETSDGFNQVDFARDVLHRPFLPWQEWLCIHAGELLPNGEHRFEIVLVLVARQNGKTEVPVNLSLYWQFIDARPLILGTSTKLDYARESWEKATKLLLKVIQRDDAEARSLAALKPKPWTRLSNGEQASWTTEGSRYKIAASNAEGGRSLTIDRLICDELRQHKTYAAWAACEPATSAVWDSQIWCLSNAGDDNSVVLNDLRAEMLEFIETGVGNYRYGLFEWSIPEDASLTDIDALCQANPSVGYLVDPGSLLNKARSAVAKGGEAYNTFETEYGCRKVAKLDPAIDSVAWRKCLAVGDLSHVRRQVAVCLDVSPDQLHATLVAAAVLPDGRVRVEPVAAWEGKACTDELRRDLPGLLARVKPRALGWLPKGPAAALAADLADRRKDGRLGWPPPGVSVEEIRGEVSAVCMGLAEQVTALRIAQADDPLLTSHVTGAEKLGPASQWVFSRTGGHCDAAYATAGAVHLARTLPAPVGRPRLIVAE